MHYGDGMILHSEKHKNLFFIKHNLHKNMVTAQGLYPVFSWTVTPLHHWTAIRQIVERRDQQRAKKRYIKFLYVNNNQESDEHGKLLEHVLQLPGRKTIFLTTIIELNGHYIQIAIYNNRAPL